jgi:hypothetical protein
MVCKHCNRNSSETYVDDETELCHDCYDFLNGHSSYNPAAPNPMLEAVQAMLDDDGDYDDDIEDDDSERENW